MKAFAMSSLEEDLVARAVLPESEAFKKVQIRLQKF